MVCDFERQAVMLDIKPRAEWRMAVPQEEPEAEEPNGEEAVPRSPGSDSGSRGFLDRALGGPFRMANPQEEPEAVNAQVWRGDL